MCESRIRNIIDQTLYPKITWARGGAFQALWKQTDIGMKLEFVR